MAGFRYVVCDVFTDTPLTGNQLAVFTNASDIPEEALQPLAREMNFSETVFVYPAAGEGDVRIRIFTPAAEIPFAGHPTLGTAFVLAGPLQKAVIRLETGAGVVPVELEREGARIVFGRMQQPIPEIRTYGAAEELLAALGERPEQFPGPLRSEARDTLRLLRQEAYDARRLQLQVAIAEASRAADRDALAALAQQMMALMEARRAFDPAPSPYFRDLRTTAEKA